MINILVNGANGKMGQECVKAINNDLELQLIATAGRQHNLTEVIAKYKPQVVVDFTVPNHVYENTLTIIDAGVHPVIGTTGLSQQQINVLKKSCAEKKLGGIIAPNFSLSAVLMMMFSQKAARFFPQIEIIEMHHTAKLDAPSGTALKTAQMIAQQRRVTPRLMEDRLPARGVLEQDIPIHSVRLPGFVATQDVIFGGLGETLTLRANAISRECFMPGVCLACKKVIHLSEMVYGLENVLGDI